MVAGHKGQVVGYVRVSAADQNEARQLEALGTVDRLFCEKVSGKNTDDRVQLQEMLSYVRDGDTVRVKSPDRLARSTTDLLAIVERLKAKGVALEFVDNPALNTDTPQGSSCSQSWRRLRSWSARPSVSVRPRVLPLPSGTAFTIGS